MPSNFPDTTLGIKIRAAFKADLTAAPSTWVWTDLSDRRLSDPMTIRRAIAAGGSSGGSTSTLSGLRLRNEDGWLTPQHAQSPYWPGVDAATPLEVLVQPDTDPFWQDAFTRTTSSGWGTSTSGHTYTLGGTSSDFSVNGTTGRMNVPALNTTRRAVSTVTARDTDITFDTSVSVTASGAALVTGAVLRWQDSLNYVWATVEYQIDGTVQVKARTSVANVLVSLGQVTVPGLTYTPGTAVRCRVIAQGPRLAMKAWLPANPEPDGWSIDTTQTTFPDSGRIGMQVWVLGTSTNTLPVTFSFDNITAQDPFYARFEGYLTDVKPQFLPQSDGTTWSTVMIDAGGVGSRLEKRTSPALSPTRRSIQAAVTPYTTGAPIAYWPLEDAEGSLTAASAYPGQAPMTVTGPAVFSFDQGVPEDLYQSSYGTKPIVSVAAGARLSAAVPISATTNQWSVVGAAQLFAPEVPGAVAIPIFEWATPSGTWTRWRLLATTTGYIVRAYNEILLTTADVVSYAAVHTGMVTYEIDAIQNGVNIDMVLLGNSAALATGSVAGTMGAVSRVVINPDRVNTTASLTPRGLRFIVGHLRVYDSTTATGVPYYFDSDQGPTPVLIWAAGAFYREAAHKRVERLCREERIPCTILGDPYASGITVLNAQRNGAFSDLLTQAVESTSGGVLYERGFGYYYLDRTCRYNQPPALTIDMAVYARSKETDQGEVLVPQLESRAANYWTISRFLGSSGTAAASEEYRNRRGTIAEERTLDVLTDDVLPDHAVWQVHVNTDSRDAYYPSIPLDLTANPAYIGAWLDTDIASRVLRISQPTVAGVNTIDQVVEGFTETIGPRSWSVEMNATPGQVWDVWSPGDPVLGWVNPPAAKLTAAMTMTSTTVQVTTTGSTWTTDPAAYPVDVEVDGERITLNGPPGGSVSPQTWTGATRSVNNIVKVHSINAVLTLWTRPQVGL